MSETYLIQDEPGGLIEALGFTVELRVSESGDVALLLPALEIEL